LWWVQRTNMNMHPNFAKTHHFIDSRTISTKIHSFSQWNHQKCILKHEFLYKCLVKPKNIYFDVKVS
jgi:hypothetical protein